MACVRKTSEQVYWLFNLLLKCTQVIFFYCVTCAVVLRPVGGARGETRTVSAAMFFLRCRRGLNGSKAPGNTDP